MLKEGDIVTVLSFNVGETVKGTSVSWNALHKKYEGQTGKIIYATGKDVLIPMYKIEGMDDVAFCGPHLQLQTPKQEEPQLQKKKSQKSAPKEEQLGSNDEDIKQIVLMNDDVDYIIKEMIQFKDTLEPHVNDKKAFRTLFFKHLELILKVYN